MSDKKSIEEVSAFAVEQLKAASIRNAVIHTSTIGSEVCLQVRRAFAIEGAINVHYVPLLRDNPKEVDGWTPVVTVNFPACNKKIVEATAFLHLVQELTLLAASLQAQLNEFTIPMKSKS
jgi:hypothetical protein